MTLQRLNEIPIGESIFGLFYGGAGTGKTFTLGTAGDDSLYCNIESRLGTLQNPKFKAVHKFNPFVITVFEEPLPSGGAKALVELTDKIKEAIKTNGNDFSKILVDGATALRRYAMNSALEVNLKSGKAGEKAQGARDKIKAVVKDFPYHDITVTDFGTEMRMTEAFIISMREYCQESGKHFFMTAHERIDYNKPARIGDEPTVRKRRPGFTGQSFPDDIPGLFDLVWHFDTKEAGGKTLYYARTEGDDSLIAKTCIGDFKPTEFNPNIQSIIKNVRGGK